MKKLYDLKFGFVTALIFTVLTSAFGQSPGGVSTDLAAWYKGDVGLAGTFWADQSGNAYNLERTSAPVGESLINFNPVASFGGVTAHQFNNLSPKLLWPVGNTTPTTYYYVAKNNAATANRAVFGIGASGDATGFHSGQQATTGTIATRGTVTFANNTGTAMAPAPPNWDIAQPNQGLNMVRTGFDGGGTTGRNYIAAQSLAEAINATNVSPTYANNAAFRIGSSGANSVFWSGDVAEVVVFSGKHDPAEYNKVETYLALKYGISKQGDYVDANDNVLYSDATYNNNISGIGRDDASGLHQKQAMSQNAGNQVLIGNGSSLFGTNADNTNDLAEGQFLVWGDNGLQKQLAESLTHNAPGGETNFRFEAIWKVQNTNGVGQVTVAWPTGITNLHLVRSTDATIDATDEFIPMTNVVTVNGVDYNTATVTFNDGDYFTFAGYIMAPGGVAGQGFWVRSDMAGDIATAWQDHSVNADDIPALGDWALSAADGAHNFHPYTTDYTTSKNFYNASTLLNPGGGDNTTSYSMFSSVRPTSTGTGRITGMGTTGGTTYGSNPSLASSAGTPRFYDYDATTTSEVFSTPFTINTTNLFSAVADNAIANGGGSSFSGGELTLGLNGVYEGFEYNNSNLFQFNGPYLRVGYSTFGTGAGVFPGDIMEVIWYNRALTPNEQSRVNSYLAIKNGVTLSEDYLNSDSDVVFSQSTNSGYTDNIFGLGFNGVSGLTQRQAKSINDGQRLIIGAGSSLFESNAENTNDLTEGQFLLAGDNGLMQGLRVPLAYTAGANGETNFRFESVWKVQNTNNVGTVTIAWPVGVQNLYLVQSTDEVFDNTDTFTPMMDIVTVNDVDYNTATVTLTDGAYFTLAGYAVSPGGVVDPDFWIKSDDAGDIETAWKDHSAYADDIPAVGTWALTPPDRAHNFHPYTTEYSASKLFYNNNNAAMHAATGVGDVANHSIFTAVRPISVTQGRIVGIDDDTNAAEPGMSITSAGLPNHYEFSNTTTNTSFPDPYIIGATNVFSTVADNAAGFGGGTSAFSGGEKRLGLNGTYETTTFTGSNRFQLVGKRVRVGHSGWTHGAAFPGDIMEVVWYNRTLTPNEQSRVNTYLAIKNGVTLAEDYLTASNAVVWDTTTNTGYNNNIFGVARDNTSALHQKQAASTNLNQRLVIGHGGSLFDSNDENTNDLTEGQFLIIGDNGLNQGLSVPLVYTAGTNGETNFRFESIWKVQNTAATGTVTVAWPLGISNMHLVRSSDEVFDNTDDFIPMTDEVIINGVSYNTASITFNDGDFFTFAGYTHAPGGVGAGLDAWHRADAFVYTDASGTLATLGQTIEQWGEFNSSGIDFSQPTEGQRPTYTPDVMLNFNPSVRFTRSSTQWLSYTFPTSTPKTEGTLYFTGKDNAIGYGSGILGMDASMDYPGWHRMAGNDYLIYHNNFTPTLSNAIASEIPNILGSSWLNGAGSTASNLLFDTRYNGFSESFNTVSNISLSTDQYRIGQDTNYGAYDGNIGETVYYSRDLDEDEKNRVDSYMGIKYGVTLREDDFEAGTFNYLSSSSTVVWDGTNNPTYHNNVFGIAHDFVSALHQKQSKSANPSQRLIIGAGTSLSESNLENVNSLTDGQFLMVGDNGLKQGLKTALAHPSAPGGEINHRFEAIWKVQNTSSTGTVIIAWPKGINNLHLVRSTDETFDISDDFIPMTDEVTINGTEYNTTTITYNDGDYFTFAGFAYAPGGVVNALSYWYRADIDAENTGVGTEVTSWTDFFSGTVISQLGGNALPEFVEGDIDYFNFNPGVNFTAATQTLGNMGVQTISELDFDIFMFTKEGVTHSGGNPRIFSSLVDNSLPSGSISRWDGIGLLADQRSERVNNSYGARYLGNPGGITFSTTIPSIMYHTFTDLTISKGLNGAANGANGTHGARGFMNGGHAFGDTRFSSNGSDNAGFIGNIGETIIYGAGNLSEIERRRVDSYLAIKYGITLGRLDALNYLSSAEETVWDGVNNPDYNNNVFGLGRDDIGALSQKISTSVNPSARGKLIVATTNEFTLANTDTARIPFSEDHTFIMFGDNDGTGETSLATDPCTGLPLDPAISTANRVWRVETTGDPESIWLQADLNEFTFNSEIELWIADDEDFTTNLVRIPAASYASGIASFNFLFTEGVKYITFGGVVAPSDCDVCTGGTFVFKMGRSWNTALERQNNVMDPESIGSTDQGDLIVNMSADYPAGVEYAANAYPRPYGRWFLSRRRDNQNVEVTHSINLNQTVAGASFQISNINTYLNNANKFTIIGYDCDDNVVLPKITHAANPTAATTYEIQGNEVIGTKRYRGLTFLHSTANVRFNRPIERIEIIFDVERVNARQTLRSLDIGDISFECAIPLPPTVDNVTMIQDFTQSEEVPSCIETTMRMRFINSNCDTRTLDISQSLPPGLEFVEDTYNDSEFGSPTPFTFDANTFALNGLELPSGTTFLYINVRSTDGTTTVYNTSSDYTVTETGNSYNSINPAAEEFSTVGFVASSFTAPDLDFLYEVDATCLDEGDQVTYTLNFDNQDPEITGATLKVYYDLGQDITSVTFNNGTSGVLGFDPIGESYIEIDDLVIPNGESSITVTLDITSEIFTDEDAASSFFELIVDPDDPCSVENPSMLSNVITLEACLGVDPELCTEEVEGNTFSSDGGIPITFNQPPTNYGFQFDIHALDNSFNMEINGVQLATQEIEFQSAGTSGINVQFADGDEYETNTAAIWQMTGTASAPLIRVVIAPNGDVSMYGSKTSGGELHLLELSNGNSFNAITWNDGAPNTIVATQSVVGVTYIYGRGSGLNSVPCPEDYCTQPPIGGTPEESVVGVSSHMLTSDEWPKNVPNGFIAIESDNSGFVITRLTTVQIDALDAVEGMLVYDTDEDCMKLYNGTAWSCIQRGCND
ncbi:hypothetical protein [Algoriphagus sp. NG3]|uniref:hypothetical protein n=1 Tax=Algoriphagus sp. NG3 TaxID=3097546 RepID=UPI002A805928|nr:hypothetical protein [Algoriphagus sp. NG3]WPR77758.1 hypothetical protein SLW71_10420 [Algoriphagus sp. NG3]